MVNVTGLMDFFTVACIVLLLKLVNLHYIFDTTAVLLGSGLDCQTQRKTQTQAGQGFAG
jgi:hypothetical protein